MRLQIAGTVALVLLTAGSGSLAEPTPKTDHMVPTDGVLHTDAVKAEKHELGKKVVVLPADIRRSIVAEKGLSLHAHHVKIVCSKDGLVTLRGPVDSEDEKSKLAILVKSCAGVTEIKNELTIAAKPH